MIPKFVASNDLKRVSGIAVILLHACALLFRAYNFFNLQFEFHNELPLKNEDLKNFPNCRHQHTIHGEKSFECHLCRYKTARKDMLVSHQKSTHHKFL